MQLSSKIKELKELNTQIQVLKYQAMHIQELIARSPQAAEAAARNGLEDRIDGKIAIIQKEIATLRSSSLLFKIISLFIRV